MHQTLLHGILPQIPSIITEFVVALIIGLITLGFVMLLKVVCKNKQHFSF
jgi:uncharacterized membrane protein